MKDFTDVDFSQEPEFVPGVIDAPDLYGSLPEYSRSVPILNEREIREAIEKMKDAGGGGSRLVTRIYDQGREGSCVANACCQAHEIVQAKQHGRHRVIPLSAISLYQRIGRSPSSGAIVREGVEELASRGALPLDTPENRERFGDKVMPNTGFYEKKPSNWEETAALLTSFEWHTLRNIWELLTALVNQDPVIVGREGHSICYAEPDYGRDFEADYPNSWSERWGRNGWGTDTRRQIEKSARWAAALRAVRSPA